MRGKISKTFGQNLNSFNKLLNFIFPLKHLSFFIVFPENQIQEFLHQLDQAILITNMDDHGIETIVFHNEIANEFLEIKQSKLLDFDIRDFLYPEDINRFNNCFRKISLELKHQKIQLRILDKNPDQVFWIELGIYCQSIEEKKQYMYVLRRIDAEIQSEQLLRQSELKHRLLFTKANDAIFIIKDLQIVDCNEKTLEMFESPGYSGISGKQLYHFMPEKQEDGSDSILNFHFFIIEALQGKSNFFKWTFSKFSGSQFETEVSLSSFELGEDKLIQVIVRDISAWKKAEQEELRAKLAEKANLALQKEIKVRIQTEEKLKIAQQYTKNIIESSLDTIVAADKEGKITDFNPAAVKAFGYSAKQAVGMGVWTLFAQQEMSEKVLKIILETGYFSGEIECKTKSGECFTGFLSASLLRNKEGSSIGTVGFVKDITYLKKSEQELKKNVEQKEVLIKEVHHRVKNNLQVINSILKLQSSYIKDKQAISAMQECQDRIKSMAFIHESLYQSKDLAKVNFSEYLRNLCNNLLFSYQSKTSKINLNWEVEEVSLSLDTAISCGLIVNELFSNALKYAFKGRKNGEIKVGLKQKGQGHELTISDNGVGIPKNIDYTNSPSLGFHLVIGLVDQIDGNINWVNHDGTQFIVHFNRK